MERFKSVVRNGSDFPKYGITGDYHAVAVSVIYYGAHF